MLDTVLGVGETAVDTLTKILPLTGLMLEWGGGADNKPPSVDYTVYHKVMCAIEKYRAVKRNQDAWGEGSLVFSKVVTVTALHSLCHYILF